MIESLIAQEYLMPYPEFEAVFMKAYQPIQESEQALFSQVQKMEVENQALRQEITQACQLDEYLETEKKLA